MDAFDTEEAIAQYSSLKLNGAPVPTLWTLEEILEEIAEHANQAGMPTARAPGNGYQPGALAFLFGTSRALVAFSLQKSGQNVRS